MKIVLDVYGGDFSPYELVKGAVDAVSENTGFELVLFGNEKEIQSLLKQLGYNGNRITVINAPETITNDDIPTEAVRKKTNSSLVAAINYLNENSDAVGLVSAGSTGAVLTGSVLLLKRIKGVNRPALCPVLPTVTNKKVLLMDCGANVDPKPINLVQFAIMASAYSSCVLNIDNPKVALLSNGAEDKKGNSLNKETFPLLKKCNKINFIGNIEGRDILSGNADVVVCDGYSGNIALKSCEGTALTMFSMIKDGIYAGGIKTKLGYLLLKPVFKQIKNKMDYNDNGGAVLLGLEKIIVKSHGSSKSKAIKNSILQVKSLYDGKVIEKIENDIGK